jgi:hypothetical protein
MSTTVEIKVHLGRAHKGRLVLREGPPPAAAKGRVPRVARLMALAIRVERLVREGTVRDYAEVARLGHVTRARVAQVTALLSLAPDLQEHVLYLPPTGRGRDPISERDLRPIAAEIGWARQRLRWRTDVEPKMAPPSRISPARV